MTVWGCQAGKDVYVEKPCSYMLWEGRKKVEAARKYNRIVQVGFNRRSELRNREGDGNSCAQGSFGPAYRARAVVYRGRINIGHMQEASIPQGVNWDLYLGPAPYRAFSLNRFHYGWHYFWDTSTTEVGNNGVHALDMVRWALGKNVHPVKIHSQAGSSPKTPTRKCPTYRSARSNTRTARWSRSTPRRCPAPPSAACTWASFSTRAGLHFLGRRLEDGEGRFTAGHDPEPAFGHFAARFESELPQDRVCPRAGNSRPGRSRRDDSSHFENFIQCVRSRKREDLHCEIEQGHLSTSLCHLANISFRTGRKLTFDPKTETFPGDEEANGFLKRKYREPYVVPDEV